MHSLRFKITAITIAAILTTFLCVFAASFFTIRAENNRSSVAMMNLIGEDTKKALEKYTESIEQSMEMIGNIAADSLDSVILAENGLIGADSRTPEQTEMLNAYLSEYSARVKEAFSSVANHTHGVITYYFCISPDVSETEHGFFFSRVGKTGFDEQEPLDARTLDPNDIEHTTWYYTPIQRGRPSWVGPYTAHFLGEIWISSYLVPIYKSGVFIGVLGMDISVETLIDQVRPIQVYDTGFACLLDDQNRVIYHPEREFGTALYLSELSDSPDIVSLRDSSGDALIRYTINGVSRQTSFCTMSNGMKLVVIAPTDEINAAWIRLARNNLLIAAAIIILFAVLIMLAMRLITNPLRLLTSASRRLAEGDYEADLNYKGRDEVGILTGAFTKMRDQIKRSIEDLNHQLRTDKLTELPNMRYFFRLVNEELPRMRAAKQSPVMIYFDLTGMRHFNRQYGFDAGDQMILAFSGFLSQHFSEHCLCRYSEDHFAALAEEETAEALLHSLFDDWQRANGGMTLPVRAGVYPIRLESVDVSVACDRAKFACDKNKGAYTPCFSWFDEKMLKEGEIYRYIINTLDRALAEGWIKVYYQPIIRAADGKICDEEALSRWIDPDKGMISPADFIPALEEAKLIYKLDLYVVEQVLAKIKRQAEVGLYVVPQSINLSRMDFDSCDIVNEIRRRVDEAGVDRSMLTIEITESVIGSDFDFMKEQIIRFQELGFKVWMDDFGSGYSSLDVLQNVHFDLLKFDMRFMDRFNSGDEAKIILTELMKMAIGLGVETICEGVEREEQVEFLREIGCAKIQGFYYGRPASFDDMLVKFLSGADMGYENPDEKDYYASIGRINLYDISVLAPEDSESLRRFFNTLPMTIIEVNGTRVKYTRCNKSYREFMQRTIGLAFTSDELNYTEMPDASGSVFMSAVMRCSRDGKAAIVDERIGEDTIVHSFIRRVAVNPVTGTAALAAAVLAVTKVEQNAGTNYAHIAKALSADYVNLYYVNLETEKFIEYSPDATREDLALERRGEDFFAASRSDAKQHIYKDDQEYFIKAFNRENIERALNTQGTFTLTYRLLMNGKPTYVNMKAVRMQGDASHIIIGVNNVDGQMRQKEEFARIQAERITYARISALSRGFICIYTIDPVTGHYIEYTSTKDYAGLGLAKEGDDFFARAHEDSVRHVCPEDIEKFQTLLTRKNVLDEIEKNGFYAFQYRVILDGTPTYVSANAALVQEQDGPQIILGISNIDAQVKREQEYEQKLAAARSQANPDTLTGV